MCFNDIVVVFVIYIYIYIAADTTPSVSSITYTILTYKIPTMNVTDGTLLICS